MVIDAKIRLELNLNSSSIFQGTLPSRQVEDTDSYRIDPPKKMTNRLSVIAFLADHSHKRANRQRILNQFISIVDSYGDNATVFSF